MGENTQYCVSTEEASSPRKYSEWLINNEASTDNITPLIFAQLWRINWLIQICWPVFDSYTIFNSMISMIISY